MSVINIIAGPLVGSVIGYFTNFIAVKMLFRPLYPVKIGGHTLPFTPGIIPRRKDAMSKAIGKAIGENLLTQEDLEKVFLSDELQKAVTEEICGYFYSSHSQNKKEIKDILQSFIGNETYEMGKERMKETACTKIIKEIHQLQIGAIITREGSKIVREKTKGTLLEMMVSDELIASIANPMGEYIEHYIDENGAEMLLPILDGYVTTAEEKTLPEVVEQISLKEERMQEMIEKTYRKIVDKKAKDLVSQINIDHIVEEKINEMDVKDIETLVLSVMEHELNAIVNLGALIGFLIGIINIFI